MRTFLYSLFSKLLVVGIFLPASVGASSVTLTFKDSALINDTVIYLGDIAAINGVDSALCARLGRAQAGEAAPPGYARFVAADDLVRFRLCPGFSGVDFRVLGRKRTSVKTDCTVRRIGDYIQEIEAYVASRLQWNREQWGLIIKNPDLNWKCFKGPVAVSLSGLKDPFHRGPIELQFTARQFDKSYRVPIVCRIAVTAPIIIARHPIGKGKIIDANDIVLEVRDIADFGPVPFFKPEAVIGTKAARTINQGGIIFDRLVLAVPAVAKGDPIVIKTEQGQVRISVAAVARENGHIGQKIWVENSVTHRLVRVVVRDKGSAVAL